MATYSYPGVYVQELQSPVHPIVGVPTSITAFVGYTATGIDNRAQQVFSFGDFERLYGGLASNSELSYAVQQFFQNGGSQAWIVRTPAVLSKQASAASVTVASLQFTALSSGTSANNTLLIDVDYIGLTPGGSAGDASTFNLTVTDLVGGTTESFPSVTTNSKKSNYLLNILNDRDNGSQLVSCAVTPPSTILSTTAPMAQTGVVGAAITAAGVGTGLGSPQVKSDAGIVITTVPATAAPPGLPITVKLFSAGSAMPQTLAGLAAQIQQAINSALAVQIRGASVTVAVTSVPGSTGGQALRINAMLPGYPDVVLAFSDPAAPSTLAGATAALGFGSAASNVAHYALGSSNSASLPSTVTTIAGTNNGLPETIDIIGDQAAFTGIYALLQVDEFNLLCIPDATRALASNPSSLDPTIDPNAIYSAAIALCDQRRAFLLIDSPPNVTSVAGAVDWKSSGLTVVDPNGAAFFPRLRLPDPLNNYQLRTFAPSGIVAGVYATTDGTRGVWKAPAGISAHLNGVQSMVYKLTDPENGVLNPLGLNCFRSFPVYGSVLWGARTLVGADAMTNQWKYVPVRRTALFIEESLYRGTQWVVFEPNADPLWASIRLNVGAFMQTLFLQGAFQGTTPAEAYFVKCDSETTTQADIDAGVVNIVVGFAPLKPAEFVVIQIEQLTGQSQP